jgi:serine/threonine protein kinase
MAPEIVNHQDHNYMKADIWALGVIFYTLISGRFPFKAQNDKDLYNKIRK